MESLLISPAEDTQWRFGAEDFQRRLTARWPAAEVTVWDDPEDPHSLSFELPMEGGKLYGHLHRSGQAVSIELAPGDEDVSELAAWVREQVPDAQALLLYDTPFNWSVPLEPGTNPAALLEELHAAAS